VQPDAIPFIDDGSQHEVVIAVGVGTVMRA